MAKGKNIYGIMPGAVLPAVLALTVAASCERRPLWYEYGPAAGFDLVPGWSRAGGVPKGCETFVFDGDGKLVSTVLSKRTDTVHLELPPGTYKALTVTYSESEYGSFSFYDKHGYEGICVSCEREAPRWKASGITKVVSSEPEWIAAGIGRTFDITDGDARVSLVPYEQYRDGVRDGSFSGWRLPTSGHEDVEMYNCTSDFLLTVWVDDAYKVRSVRATVSGMSTGWLLSGQRPLRDTLSLTMERRNREVVDADTGLGILTCDSNCFGLPDLGRSRLAGDNRAKVYFSLGDGSTVARYVDDAGDRITVEADPTWRFRNLLRLEIGSREHPVELPDVEYDTGRSMFDAWVDGWNDGGTTVISF